MCKAGRSLAATAAMSQALNSVAMEWDKRQLAEREVVPHQQDCGRDRRIDRAEFARAAKAGIYALQIDERFGGAGEDDYRYRTVVCKFVAEGPLLTRVQIERNRCYFAAGSAPTTSPGCSPPAFATARTGSSPAHMGTAFKGMDLGKAERRRKCTVPGSIRRSGRPSQ